MVRIPDRRTRPGLPPAPLGKRARHPRGRPKTPNPRATARLTQPESRSQLQRGCVFTTQGVGTTGLVSGHGLSPMLFTQVVALAFHPAEPRARTPEVVESALNQIGPVRGRTDHRLSWSVSPSPEPGTLTTETDRLSHLSLRRRSPVKWVNPVSSAQGKRPPTSGVRRVISAFPAIVPSSRQSK
jgi:hypothetical protein